LSILWCQVRSRLTTQGVDCPVPLWQKGSGGLMIDYWSHYFSPFTARTLFESWFRGWLIAAQVVALLVFMGALR